MTEIEFLRQALWLADRRGYKSGWQNIAFHQKYGKWPSKKLLANEILPMPPSDEFWDWLEERWGKEAVVRVREWLRAMWKVGDGSGKTGNEAT
jgi:hypothetical protein